MEIKETIPAADTPAILLLAAGGTLIEAAKAVGVSRNTMAVRAVTPAYRAAIRAVRQAAIDRATGKLIQALDDAFACIHLISTSGEQEANKLRAARAIFDLVLQYREHGELAERVAALEAAASGRATGEPVPEPVLVQPE